MLNIGGRVIVGAYVGDKPVVGIYVGDTRVYPPKMPAFKRRLAYIESTGTQFIDTGIVGKSGMSCFVGFNLQTPSDAVVLGSRKGSGNNRFYLVAVYGTYATYGYDLYNFTASLAVKNNTNHTAESSLRAGAQIIVLDGVKSMGGAEDLKIDTGFTMYLFACNVAGVANYPFMGRISACRIYDEDVLVRGLIPVLDENDVPCMFDLVRGEFLYNQGTGTFAYGELDGGAVAATYTSNEIETMRAALPSTMSLRGGSPAPQTDEEVVRAWVQAALAEEEI